MLVEDPESFKEWMTKVLEPMCDADPEALAKYVYALVKKDKSIDVLKQCMVSQLEVFLQAETVGFVELLFRRLESETAGTKATPPKDMTDKTPQPEDSFNTTLTAPVENILLNLKIENEEKTSEDKKSENSPEKPVVQPKNPIAVGPNFVYPFEGSDNYNRTYETTDTNTNAPANERLISHSGSSSEKLTYSSSTTSLERHSSFGSQTSKDQEKEERGSASRSRRRRDSSLSPPRRYERSRSKSWDRSAQWRSRSRDKDRDRGRIWRNKSPSSRRYDRDRRRSWSKSPVRRMRSHSRTPPSKQRLNRYRNRSPPIGRSRSRSPYDRNDKLSPLSRGGTPTQDSNHGDTDMRLPQSHSIQSIVSVKDNHQSNKRRCRDFDEKGYCMRGELCPFDHGSDPVVLEDVVLPPTLSFPAAPSSGMDMVPPTTAMVPGAVQPMLPPSLHEQNQIRPNPMSTLEYNPDAPSMGPRMWIRQPFRPQGRNMMHAGIRSSGPGQLQSTISNFSVQRELINVPVVEGETYAPIGINKRPRYGDFGNEDVSPLKQRQFDYSRLGPRRGLINRGLGLGNCSLELKKIPPGLNVITHLNNHFAKFGKIVNIQVYFEGDPEAALITFSSHAEASAAYKSTEAVLNNRFIKVFWHNNERDGKQENVPPIRASVKERLGTPHLPQPPEFDSQSSESSHEIEKVLVSGHNITKTVYIPTALKKTESKPSAPENKVLISQSQANNNLTGASLSRSQEIQVAKDILRKKKEEKRREAQQLTLHLCKRKQGLLDKAFNQQKTLIERLEKGNLTQEQRDNILQTIKALQEQSEVLRKDIKKVVAMKNTSAKAAVKLANPQVFKKTREETQKQILDAELDIFNRQQEGKDTTDLQKRVLELKTKAQRLGLLGQGKVIRGRGGIFRGRGRGGASTFMTHSSIDHRPTKFLVSGFESDDKTEVLAHFAKFGDITDYIWDEVTPALVVNFKTRKEAETAMNKGRNFQDRLLCANWYNSGQPSMRNSLMRSVLMMDEDEEDVLLDDHDEDEELRINLESTEDFLLHDEEEEEDEDRTWRR